jgi:alpha-1,2-mannosyltransferase
LIPSTRARLPISIGWAAVLCSVLLAQTYLRAQRPNGIDLTSYLLSADVLRHGGSPYLLPTPFPYVYPATLALLLIPLAFVPATVAVLVWFALNLVAVVWCTRAIVLRLRPDARSADLAPFLALFFTVFFTIAQSNLRNGQVNFIVLALSVFAAIEAESLVAWPLGIALKILPLVLAPYFMLRRSWQWMIVSMALIVAWCLLPVVVVGRRIVDIYQQFARVLQVMNLSRIETLDFSFAGTVSWITRAPLTPVLEASGAAVVLGWIIAVDGRRLRGESLRPMALYLLAIPLVSPHSEVHHLAFMLPAATIVTSTLWWDGRAAGRRQQLSAVAAVLLYLVATVSPILTGPLFFAALIAFGVALMSVPAQGRLKPAATESTDRDANPSVASGFSRTTSS